MQQRRARIPDTPTEREREPRVGRCYHEHCYYTTEELSSSLLATQLVNALPKHTCAITQHCHGN